MANCRSCNAPIEWAEWEHSGKAVPLDPGVFADGNIAVVGHGRCHKYTEEDQRLARPRRRTHFVSCPDSPKWRQPRMPGNQ